MRIILDENLPRLLNRIFPGHTVNGVLLAHLEGAFDVFITADKNFEFQAARQCRVVHPHNRDNGMSSTDETNRASFPERHA